MYHRFSDQFYRDKQWDDIQVRSILFEVGTRRISKGRNSNQLPLIYQNLLMRVVFSVCFLVKDSSLIDRNNKIVRTRDTCDDRNYYSQLAIRTTTTSKSSVFATELNVSFRRNDFNANRSLQPSLSVSLFPTVSDSYQECRRLSVGIIRPETMHPSRL